MAKKSRKTSRNNSRPKSLTKYRKAYRVGRATTGLGLFATKPIVKGKLFIEYTGPRLRNSEIKREDKYMFEINNRWTVDGKPRRNKARYANHSCRPNAESDIIGGRIYLRAIRHIQPGAEITYDYGRDHFNAFIKPLGCKCAKCIEKRREERAAKRRKAARRRKREEAGRARI
jgi:hypothetical protein